MFGHSTNLVARVRQHKLAATPHGFALIDGWASPGVRDAYPLEQMALDIGMYVHGRPYRERFYDMPFNKGLSICRAIFEANTNWRSHSKRFPQKVEANGQMSISKA
jgi:hypothetical protein